MGFVSVVQFLSQLVFNITFVATLVGLIYVIFHLVALKDWRGLLILIVFPFYIVRVILRMPESDSKKILAIFVLGGFVLSLFFNIIRIVLTPPV